MQRRIEQADTDWLAFHDPEKLREIIALHGEQTGKDGSAPFARFGKDHLPHDDKPRRIKEHMLGPAEADPLRVEVPRGLRVFGRVSVHPDADIALRIGPSHQALKGIIQRRFEHVRRTGQHFA